MSLLLVVVLLFFSSSSSVSSHQYYVSDDCSSVTHTPCNPLSVYAGNMSQYSNTIFYFIGTSSINFNFTMESVQNITLHGLDHSPTIYCKNNNTWFTVINSSHVNFSNISFQHCYINFEAPSNIMITGSIFKILGHVRLINAFDSKITSSVFDNVPFEIYYGPPSVCYNELHHYSLTLTDVNMTDNNSYLGLCLYHGTSYNLSVIFDHVNVINEQYGVYDSFSESLFSLFITNSSVSNSSGGFASFFVSYFQESTKCNIKGVQSQSTIVTEDSQFHNNIFGLGFVNRYQFSNHHIIITVKSCSIHDNDRYGLFIDGRLSTSTHISVIDTELIGNKRNEIMACHSTILNNITVTNSLSTVLYSL